MLQMIISERITYMLLTAITIDDINDNVYKGIEEETVDNAEDGVYVNYLHFFRTNQFYIE